MISKTIQDLMKNTSLETRIKVNLQMDYITLLCDERGWKRGEVYDQSVEDELDKIHQDAAERANMMTKYLLDDIVKWKKDGAPLKFMSKKEIRKEKINKIIGEC